jgi:hypothetical protein
MLGLTAPNFLIFSFFPWFQVSTEKTNGVFIARLTNLPQSEINLNGIKNQRVLPSLITSMNE